ncbi:MAG: HD domain-containing protein [Deltaproteobacteria bacterium]
MPDSASVSSEQFLDGLRQRLDAREEMILSPYACKSHEGIRRRVEEKIGLRQCFALDADRILHSRAYTRYIDKTQVFYMVENDHITHRVLHVQLVSKIARTIGRFLGLNEDLIEAIALGHDIGHPPFGHDGERFLSKLCKEAGLHPFLHNVQSVFFLEDIERGGRGWNLTLQTLDGILCHDGEVHNRVLTPHREKDFPFFDRQILVKQQNPKTDLLPMTLEGCLVRFADTVAYVGRDIEDAIILGLITREEIPAAVQDTLGKTNGTIVYTLVADLIRNSVEQGYIAFSAEMADRLLELKKFNYERIYLNPAIKKDTALLGECYEALFSTFYRAFSRGEEGSAAASAFLAGMSDSYRQNNSPAAMSRDFIAGMTDDYFISQAQKLGCRVPDKS